MCARRRVSTGKYLLFIIGCSLRTSSLSRFAVEFIESVSAVPSTTSVILSFLCSLVRQRHSYASFWSGGVG